ncbi:MAG: DUF3037 domain-containing protein [Patulibacter sp.]
MAERVAEPYSWTLLRVVPRVERGEQLNVGAAVFFRGRDELRARILVDEVRLRALDPQIDLDAVRAQLDGLMRVAAGDPAAGRVAGMAAGDRFGFIAAPSSTIVQASPVHTGLCVEGTEQALDALLARYVRI